MTTTEGVNYSLQRGQGRCQGGAFEDHEIPTNVVEEAAAVSVAPLWMLAIRFWDTCTPALRTARRVVDRRASTRALVAPVIGAMISAANVDTVSPVVDKKNMQDELLVRISRCRQDGGVVPNPRPNVLTERGLGVAIGIGGQPFFHLLGGRF